MEKVINYLSPSHLFETDYEIISHFYGRDLGGKDFFIWKHLIDIDRFKKPTKRTFRHQDNLVTQGIIVSTLYSFSYNNQYRTANIIGDLGIDDTVKSPKLLKDLLLAGHQQNTDMVICYSDDRKIAIYKKIFDKYTLTSNYIIPFIDTLLQPNNLSTHFDEINPEELGKVFFSNNLGRLKDQDYFAYLQKNPLYRRFYFLQHDDFYCVLGLTDDYVEILELSHTSNEIFQWAIQASRAFHCYCKVLLPKSRFTQLTVHIPHLINLKPLNLLLSFHHGKELDINPDHIWISRLERR
ncbi:hypothetical protein AC790_04320 [Pantoea sp. RIT-PI-b]|uniref:hypothetical protein n=1 Tax=Pantoea sp. RIT-PI-b TaxID=1681195 RepID=UPI0006761658|nr:hypothetical protein [Pantoea sp. RIT-PI-b]KNC15566.1 hypothetical protein AC790_04320 [Pantoea sp. RIT-PI-b]